MTDGPAAAAHGWYAQSYDGTVHEVWIFGDGRGLWFGVNAAGAVVFSGQGEPSASWVADSKTEAVLRALEHADAELTRARAAVDALRAEL